VKRKRWIVLVCIAVACAGAGAQSEKNDGVIPPPDGPWPKVILFGSVMDPRFMAENPSRLEELPFHGYILHGDTNERPDSQDLALARSVYGPRRLRRENYTNLIESMRKVRQTVPAVTENFIQISPLPGTLVDRPDNNLFPDHDEEIEMWFSEDFDIVLHNIRLAAEVAQAAGLRGLMLDVEPYGGRLWQPDRMRDARARGAGFDTTWKQVRTRAEQFMQAMEAGYPGLTVFLTFGYEQAVNPGYRLLAPFLDGLFAAAGPEVRIVCGYEQYRLFSREDFLEGYWFTHCWSRQRCAVPDAYQARVSAAFPVWPEVNGWDAEAPTARFPPERYQEALVNALSTADHYVWVYSEGLGRLDFPNWWTGRSLPEAYIEATRQALKNAAPPLTTQPNRAFLEGESAYSRRITYEQWRRDRLPDP
jgi:hypothetical protein